MSAALTDAPLLLRTKLNLQTTLAIADAVPRFGHLDLN
jgi:hypothetical protein